MPPDAPRALEGLVAAPLAGAAVASEHASIVVVEWRDPGGGTDPPTYSEYLGRP